MTGRPETVAVTGPGLVTSQSVVHPRLTQIVQRHLLRPWKQPLHRPSVVVYESFQRSGGIRKDQPFILDSGCGTGQSTCTLAQQFPQHLVIGVDRSAARLSRSGVVSGIHRYGNCVYLRAELTTLWRLLLNDGLWPVQHFLLYPNPWPKPGHLKRRWHAHPVFPQLLLLGGEIVLRCNWEVYALEFAHAVTTAVGQRLAVNDFRPASYLTAFEKKYHQRGQRLFSVVVPAQLTADFRRLKRC